jgi:hypothetical protein
VHQRFRHKPCWQPIYRKRYSFITVTLCPIVVFRSIVFFCSTTVTFCEDQYHGGSACHTAFAVGKPAYPKHHTWRWGIEPCRHLPERQCGAGGTPPQHGHKG